MNFFQNLGCYTYPAPHPPYPCRALSSSAPHSAHSRFSICACLVPTTIIRSLPSPSYAPRSTSSSCLQGRKHSHTLPSSAPSAKLLQLAASVKAWPPWVTNPGARRVRSSAVPFISLVFPVDFQLPMIYEFVGCSGAAMVRLAYGAESWERMLHSFPIPMGRGRTHWLRHHGCCWCSAPSLAARHDGQPC